MEVAGTNSNQIIPQTGKRNYFKEALKIFNRFLGVFVLASLFFTITGFPSGITEAQLKVLTKLLIYIAAVETIAFLIYKSASSLSKSNETIWSQVTFIAGVSFVALAIVYLLTLLISKLQNTLGSVNDEWLVIRMQTLYLILVDGAVWLYYKSVANLRKRKIAAGIPLLLVGIAISILLYLMAPGLWEVVTK